MSIEVRNFRPANASVNISLFSDLSFDLVALDDYEIDITSLEILLSMTSNIDEDEHTMSFTEASTEVSYSGDATYYRISLNPSVPFDEGLDVTVTVNVEGTDELDAYYMMEEFESSFTTHYDGVISDFKYAFIHYAQKIPVFDEPMRKIDSSSTPKVFKASFPSWNKTPAPIVHANSVIISSNDSTYGYSIDYESGLINFTNELEYNDAITVSYKFAFFTDEQIQSFFDQAAAIWRLNPPFGGPATIYNANASELGALLIGASTFAFRELLFSLAFQKIRIVFDNASWGDGWIQAKDLFKSLFDSYNEDWKSILEAKKVRLPAIRNIITPSYTMPGGRTLSSLDLCELPGGQFINFNTMFNMIDEGLPVDVLSNNKGNLSFSRVSCIEYEGRKDVFGVGISTGEGKNLRKHQINTSLDHKYETPFGMKRLKDLNINDSVLINQNGKIIKGKIEEVGYNGFLDCYEIQVPETEKFFCNSVSVSNSRMFRYLYK